MTFPSKPDPAYDYSGFQASQPASPMPGNQLVNDFANLKTASDAMLRSSPETGPRAALTTGSAPWPLATDQTEQFNRQTLVTTG